MKVGGYLDNSLLRLSGQPLTNTQTTQNSDENASASKNEALTSSEKAQITKLQASDAGVRRHEAAHIASGGGVIKSGASFSYQQGPDGKLYAIGGEVAIDSSSEADPQATIAKMQVVRSAALAPSDPSSTDYSVAATASMIEMQARIELGLKSREELIQKGAQAYSQTQDSPQLFSQYA
ncbi:MAG: hypothetical protein IBX44_00585 [Sulfurospirillum sp.]|nr:hypothetical protein [Sulfurospirillum sp.]